MKRNLLFLLLFVVLTGCSKQNSASIEVSVLKNGTSVGSGTSVYMFKPSSADKFGYKKQFSVRSVATNNNGVAEFILTGFELDQFEKQNTYHFVVYKDNDDNTPSSTVVTVNKGGSASATIRL